MDSRKDDIMAASEKDPSHKPAICLDIKKIRRDFPIFSHPVNGAPLVYLDNAATTQKPKAVIDAIARFYTRECSSIHRGAYYLSERATASYETSREKVRNFINAHSIQEIVFVRGATEGINLVAHSYGRTHLEPDDEILISAMEHHSNIVPWQMLCNEKHARLRIVPVSPAGDIAVQQYTQMLGPKTRLVALTHVSNVLGTINPVRELIRLAHDRGIPVLLDGAQSVAHMRIDVQALDCDFFVFSGHKMYGPCGVGVLYGKEDLLDAMPPYQSGGDMISSVTFEKTLYNRLPYKFEAGTPNVADGIGLGVAIDYVQSLGLDNISARELDLTSYATRALQTLDELRIIGTAREKTSVLSFMLKGIHPHDIGTILDHEGIAIRAGHHCAQPLMDFFGIPSTARVSLGLYNTREDIEKLMLGLKKVLQVFRQ
jgi:cysteine desulfurase/selenocysteine lyase